MRLSISLAAILARGTATPNPVSQLHQLPLQNAELSNDGFRIPTPHESAIMARRMLRLESIGTISTIFPHPNHKSSSSPSSSTSDDNNGDYSLHITENRPDEVAGSPLGLMEYFADCEPSTGHPTILAVSIANTYRNAAAGSNVTLSFRWHPPAGYGRTPPYAEHSPAALPRLALTGYLEAMTEEEIQGGKVVECFTRYHPEARIWLPGNDIHSSYFTRLVVRDIYWFGGFGDRAYIGWLNASDYRGVTEEEIQSTRLPGEKKETASWRSWLHLDF